MFRPLFAASLIVLSPPAFADTIMGEADTEVVD